MCDYLIEGFCKTEVVTVSAGSVEPFDVPRPVGSGSVAKKAFKASKEQLLTDAERDPESSSGLKVQHDLGGFAKSSYNRNRFFPHFWTS